MQLPRIGDFRDSARSHFEGLVLDRATHIARRCWTMNLGSKLEEIAKAIGAARKLGATEAAPLSKEMVHQMVADLTTFRDLEMSEAAYAYLRGSLETLGIKFLPEELPAEK